MAIDKKVLNVPHLRFPEFSGEWKKYSFNDIAQYKKGPFGSALKKEIFVPKSADSVKIYEQQNAIKKDWELGRYYISRDYFINHMQQFIVEAGDIIVSCAGTIGEIYELPPNAVSGVFNQALMRVRINATLIDKNIFIKVFSSMIDSFSKIYSNGSAIKNIPPFADLKKTNVFLPTQNEQYKISRLISLLDERIATQNKIIEKYESLIQAMCDTLIESEQLKVELSFNDFGKPYSGLSGKSAEDFGNGWPYITYMNVYQNQIIDITDVGLVKINETEQQSVVRYGDILFTLSSETPDEVGMGAVYLGDAYPLYLNSFCFGVHITDESKIFSPFLAYYISTKSFRKAVFPLAQGSTRFNLQKNDFMKKIFHFPTVKKQSEIYSVLKAYSDKLSIEKNIVNLLCEQKSYLLRQLFI